MNSHGRVRISRRAFLLSVLVMGLVSTLAWFNRRRLIGDWNYLRVHNYLSAYSGVHKEPVQRIVDYFDHLDLDRQGVEKYVEAFEAKYGKLTLRSFRTQRLLFQEYLLASDYFTNGSDDSKTVHFVALRDPDRAPCWIAFT